jgi:hypothetical protein
MSEQNTPAGAGEEPQRPNPQDAGDAKPAQEKPIEKEFKAEGEKFAKEIEKVKSDWEKFPKEKFEHKEGKIEIKEGKPEKEKHEIKEHKPEKEKFEAKEHKIEKLEFEKNKVEGEKVPVPEKGVKEAEGPQVLGAEGLPLDRDTLLRHAQALENMGRELRHFIEQGDRPDLSRGALHDEPDQSEQGEDDA